MFQEKIDQVPKTPPFSHNQNFSPTRDQILQLEYFGQIKNSNSTIFKILKWLADPIALAFISPPLALSTKTGSRLAL
jgi:hypothetical protein